MTTAIRSEATRSVVVVNGVDVLSVKPDGQLDILTTTGLTDTHIPLMKQFAAITTTSGTSHDQLNIPSWAKKITISLNGVSTNGASNLQIQLGTSGGLEITGYVGGAEVNAAAAINSTGIQLTRATGASSVIDVNITLHKHTGNTWIVAGTCYIADVLRVGYINGKKSLSGTLDRIRLTTANGTDQFDAGSFSVLVEG